MFFVDTCALVKYFHHEQGTSQVIDLIDNNAHKIWISELSRIEFITTIFKKHRQRLVDNEQLELVITAFDECCQLFNIEPLSPSIVKEAEKLIAKYGKIQGLRTLDALQFGAFMLIAENDWCFVSSDDLLCRVVQIEGFDILNPCL